MQDTINQYAKEHNVRVLFASIIGSSIYTDREPNDIDIFVVYDKEPTTLLESHGLVEHHKYNNVDITAVSLGKYLNLVKYGSFLPYDAMFKGSILIDNLEFKELIQNYYQPRLLAKVYMKLFDSEFDLDKLSSTKDYSRVLQYIINIHWLLKGKYAPTKLADGCDDSLRSILDDVVKFTKGYIDSLSDMTIVHLKEIKKQQSNELDNLSGSILDNQSIITNYVKGKLNAIL